MAEADKDLQKAVDEHLKRLYEQYKSNNKVFTATHIGHLTLSIVFVLSILLPFLYLQWFTIPVVSFFLSALPGLDAHTRLMFGKRLEYRVTEKV